MRKMTQEEIDEFMEQWEEENLEQDVPIRVYNDEMEELYEDEGW